MSNFILSCCSAVDLTAEYLEEKNISCLHMHYFLDGKKMTDDFGKTISNADFYKAMENGAETKTTQCNIDEYEEYFVPMLEAGHDILHVTLSSGISGTYNSARIAAEDLSVKYPDRKIYVVDSLGASSGYGLLMAIAADMRDSGKSIEEIRNWLIENRLKLNHWFFSTDLTFYIKGGRVSRTAGVFGTILKICPLLNMNIEGKLIPRKKIRGKTAVIKAIVDSMEETAQDGLDYSGKCFMSQSACREDAEKVAAMIKERFPKIDGDVQIFDIGALIGSHSGPGTVAVFFLGKDRTI